MATRTIAVRVSDEAARVYEAATEDECRKLDALVTVQLTRTRRPERSLEEVTRDLSGKAQERGLTPEILDEILNGRD